MKNTLITFLVLIVIGFGAYFVFKSPAGTPTSQEQTKATTPTDDSQKTSGEGVKTEDKSKTVIGKSIEGRDIVAYHYGAGTKEILFVGGIHGGYSWNTAKVAYETMDYLKENSGVIPKDVKVTVIPVLNPDGLFKVVSTTENFKSTDVNASQAVQTAGRFNSNNVDINRNFDCSWQASAKWQSKTVSGGSAVFSEPESQAIKTYVEASKPTAVVAWYSSAGGVYSSSCDSGVSLETNAITNLYSKASGYPAYESFNVYETTGDMVNWLAKNNIPAISVLLTNHTDTEWVKNQKGIEALLKYYSK
ncbi:MAG: hypothetical protein EXS59_02545 [Candidatus Taylorbacteria bacterium]|nr:hypothetical protein [Candidatus Taylorbacteria bacterium]